MGHEWLETVAAVLEAAGIRAGEEYPAGRSREITEPVAALGIEEVDGSKGIVRISVKILSPRHLGSWACQSAAVAAVAALEAEGISGKSGAVSYQNGNDCFCVAVTASMEVRLTDAPGMDEKSWTVRWNEVILEGVEKFTVQENRGRRIVGAFCQAEPVGVTPPSGGFSLALVQVLDGAEPEEPEEPFTLTVTDRAGTVIYQDCCWNQITKTHTAEGLRVERSGFALSRKED